MSAPPQTTRLFTQTTSLSSPPLTTPLLPGSASLPAADEPAGAGYPCSQCTLVLASDNQRKYHQRMQHQTNTAVRYKHGHVTVERNEDTTFHCLYCKKTYKDPDKLKAHGPDCPKSAKALEMLSDEESSPSQETIQPQPPPEIRESDYLCLPDEYTVAEHPECNLPPLGIVINTLLRVAICIQCKRPIQLSALVSHLNDHLDFIEVPVGLVEELQSLFNLTEDIVWPKKPTTPIFPISILPTPFLFCGPCNKGYKNLEGLFSHQRTRSCLGQAEKSASYHYGYAHFIKYGSKRRFVEITVDNLVKKGLQPMDSGAVFMSQLPGSRDFANMPVRGPEDDMNLSSFYHRDGWLKHMEGYNAVDLSEAYRTSTREDEEGDILRNLAFRYIKGAQDNIENHGGFGLMRAMGSVMPTAKTDENQHSLGRIDAGSIKTYSLVLHKLVFNCLRFYGGTWTSTYKYPDIDASQQASIDELRRAVDQTLGEEKAAEGPEELDKIQERHRELLDGLFHALCFKLFAHTKTQYPGTQPPHKFFSPVICFAAIQCIHSSGGTLKASMMTQVLAALMYSLRSCMLKEVCNLKTRDSLPQPEAFALVQPFLIDQRETPMAFLFNAMSLLKRIRQNEVMDSDFTFSDASGNEISYRGHRITVNQLKTMVNGTLETYRDALQTVAFFGEEFPEHLFPKIVIEDIFDNTQNRAPGYSFLEDPRNQFHVYRGVYGKWLLSDPERADKLAYFNGSKFVWKPQACERFLRQLESCRDHLLVGLLISAGPASRSTETARQVLREIPGCHRNLLILFRNLCLVAIEDKTTRKTLREKYVPHLPTREWAEALLHYLIIIRDFEEFLVEQLFPKDSDVVFRYRHQLWPGLRRTMSGEDLSDKLGLVTRKYLGGNYKIRFWRQLVTQFSTLFKDQYLFEIHKEFFVDTANMHSTDVSIKNYTAPPSGLGGSDNRSIVGCIKVGLAWHKLLNIGQERPLTLLHTKDENDTGSSTLRPTGPGVGEMSGQAMAELVSGLTNNVLRSLEPAMGDKFTDVLNQIFAEALTRFWPKPPIALNSANLRPISDVVVHPSRRRDLRLFLRDPKAKFTCPEQGVLLEYMLEGRENLLGILGTGFGKTTLILMMAKMYSNGNTTVVILPLSALHADLERRATQYGLVVSKWTPDPKKFNPDAHIITCAVEYLQIEPFRRYLMTLQNTNRLYRLIFDEVHKIVTDITFRDSFNFFWALNIVQIPVISLTASFPEHLIETFSLLTKTTWKIIRMSSNRKELAYHVINVDPKAKSLIQRANEYLEARIPDYSANDRAIVFCRSTKKADEMASSMKLSAYHSQSLDTNDETMKRWLAGKQNVMVSTSILGCGLDYPSIRDVVHLDLAYSILDQYQEDSRGGRDGEPCNAVTIIANNRRSPDTKHRYKIGIDEVYEWATTKNQCHRLIPSLFLDGVPVTCTLLDDAEFCGYCLRLENENPPDHVVGLPIAGDVSKYRIRSDWYVEGDQTAARHTSHPEIVETPLKQSSGSMPDKLNAFRPPQNPSMFQTPKPSDPMRKLPDTFRPPQRQQQNLRPPLPNSGESQEFQRRPQSIERSLPRPLPVDEWKSSPPLRDPDANDSFQHESVKTVRFNQGPEGHDSKRRRVQGPPPKIDLRAYISSRSSAEAEKPKPTIQYASSPFVTSTMPPRQHGGREPSPTATQDDEMYCDEDHDFQLYGESSTPITDYGGSTGFSSARTLIERTPKQYPYEETKSTVGQKRAFSPSPPNPPPRQSTRPAKTPSKVNAGITSRMASITSALRDKEWDSDVVDALRAILDFFFGKCIDCFVRGADCWVDHVSDQCPSSDLLSGKNGRFTHFRSTMAVPKGLCFGCYIDIKNADHTGEIGQLCAYNGIAVRLCYAYKTYWTLFPACPLFPEGIDATFGFKEWLMEVVDEGHENYWCDVKKKRYNAWVFLLWFAEKLQM